MQPKSTQLPSIFPQQACRPFHTQPALCREILYEEGKDGQLEVTGLRLGRGPHTEVVHADAYVAALDLPGAQRVIPPAWRSMRIFDDIYRLSGVPVITVQLRCSLARFHISSSPLWLSVVTVQLR